MMHGFSTVDGFVEISECLAEMIKYVANEPSVGLFYVQQHTQNAVPNILNLRNNIVEKSWETNLHTEDLEDSITMMRSMKECGFPIADEMVKDIRKSLAIMSTKQPRKGLINKPTSSFQVGRTLSWGSSTWGHNGSYDEKDGNRTSTYLSTVFKSAKEKASNFKWPQLDTKESSSAQIEKPLSCANPSESAPSTSIDSSVPDLEADELPLSSQTADELVVDKEEQFDVNPSSHIMKSVSENFEEFKADKEAKLEEWLGGTDDSIDKLQETK
ncbi:hypothetical protein Tsubulata_020209 [Turnera subulata]|uniref:Uncharacterized protein n=1 Tax=Turnera subulata TaxID=218843 RepID=A0A9Q0FNF4_9ROSI|nr:hypothetical protein Tsubulata_020209 [Turnera subulata]